MKIEIRDSPRLSEMWRTRVDLRPRNNNLGRSRFRLTPLLNCPGTLLVRTADSVMEYQVQSQAAPLDTPSDEVCSSSENSKCYIQLMSAADCVGLPNSLALFMPSIKHQIWQICYVLFSHYFPCVPMLKVVYYYSLFLLYLPDVAEIIRLPSRRHSSKG